jgi:rod shape-determining protein MreC
MRRVFALIVIVIAVVLFVGHYQFVVGGKSLGTAAIGKIGGVVTSSNSNLNSEVTALQQENASLRVQLFDQSLTSPTNTVEVYSDYPLNSKQEILIAAGSNEGVKEGDVVTWGSNVLIGKVITVLGDSSIVSTVFDPSWQMAVRIGSSQIDGLLQGGVSPTVTLIPQNGQINVGDMVIAAASGFPYGMEVGVVENISDTPNSVFRQAALQTEVDISDLRNVTVHD